MVPSILVGDRLGMGMLITVSGVEPPLGALGAAKAKLHQQKRHQYQQLQQLFSLLHLHLQHQLSNPESTLLMILAITPTLSASMVTTALSV